MNACPVPSSDLGEKYTALHEGLQPEEYLCDDWVEPDPEFKLGKAFEIQYLKKIPSEVPRYHHPWAEYAQPTIAVDSNRSLIFYAGKCETTRRGIEDRVLPGMPTVEYLKQPYVQPERLPSKPVELITLGTLEFVRYKNEDGSIRKLSFDRSIAPEIAVDQKGDLHVLHGQYVITDAGTVEPVRDNPRGVHGQMKHAHRSRHHGRRHHARRPRHSGRRHNPSAMAMSRPGETTTQRAMRMVMNSVVVGGVATLTAVGLNLGLAKFWPTGSAGAKAATKVGVGLLGGIGLAYALPSYPSIAAGFSVGGVIDGFLDLYNLYVAPRLAAMTTPAVSSTTPPTGTLPAGQAWGAPIPRQYAGYAPASCGI